MLKFSVVIPVLNERANLPLTIDSIQKSAGVETVEIIVVDGGSADGTWEWLAPRNDLRALRSERGRGRQMQTGAAQAAGDALLFLHADCQLPANAFELLTNALADPLVAGGCFLIGFAEQRPFSLRVVAAGINARTNASKTGTGDQGIFVRRDIFADIGGIKSWPLFEDVDLVTRIRRRGKFTVIQASLIISARRWLQQGIWRTTFLMWWLRLGYWLGISPERLRRWFVDVRT
ncbi:MAG: TIGR04283 family arsenosugar biosynthesis glycosyltransferase [Blastocatellia bacterium]